MLLLKYEQERKILCLRLAKHRGKEYAWRYISKKKPQTFFFVYLLLHLLVLDFAFVNAEYSIDLMFKEI